MVPWTHVREHFLKWMWTDLTSEFTHFNVVIHLSSETVGLSVMHLFRRPCCSCCHGELSQCSSEALPNYLSLHRHLAKLPQTFFFTAVQAVFNATCPRDNRHVLFLQVWYSLVSGEVKHIVHLIHLNLNSCLCPCGLTWLWSRLGVTHGYFRLNWIPFSLLSFFLLFTS